jgi:hypothetical protein
MLAIGCDNGTGGGGKESPLPECHEYFIPRVSFNTYFNPHPDILVLSITPSAVNTVLSYDIRVRALHNTTYYANDITPFVSDALIQLPKEFCEFSDNDISEIGIGGKCNTCGAEITPKNYILVKYQAGVGYSEVSSWED